MPSQEAGRFSGHRFGQIPKRPLPRQYIRWARALVVAKYHDHSHRCERGVRRRLTFGAVLATWRMTRHRPVASAAAGGIPAVIAAAALLLAGFMPIPPLRAEEAASVASQRPAPGLTFAKRGARHTAPGIVGRPETGAGLPHMPARLERVTEPGHTTPE